MDVLSDVLRAIRLYATSYFCVEFSAPWGLDEPETESGTFHAIIKGNACVTSDQLDAPIHLSAGDIIAFPTGIKHKISDASKSHFLHGFSVLEMIKLGENPFNKGQDVVTILCGYFHFEKNNTLPLLRDLPLMLHVKTGVKPELSWMNSIVNLLANESQHPKSGSKVIVDRITEVLVIQLFRWHMNNKVDNLGYFKALADEKLSYALSLMHRHPDKYWTVETLGLDIGMSRTAFSKRFSDVIGMGPLAYLRQWRMHLAHTLLEDGSESIRCIAEKVGYKSEASFSRTFKKIVGISPGQVRNGGLNIE